MPPLTRWYIKLALAYLVAALLAGVLQGARAVLALPPAVVAAVGPAQVHLFVVGWVTQMIFGVAYWMFPKYAPDAPRGNDALAVATFVLLNTGLVMRVVVEPWHAIRPAPALGVALAVSAGAQWLAGLGFAANTWSRVRVR